MDLVEVILMQMRRLVAHSIEAVFADEETKAWLRREAKARLGG